MELYRCSDCANGAWTGEERTLPEVCTICRYKSDGVPSEWKPKVFTNADRIRAMSDEELAEFLVVANPTNCLDCAFSCGWRCQPDRQDYSDTEKCLEGKKRWLKQPAEE